MNSDIFKAYDVRGIYPEDIDEDAAYAIGYATAITLNANSLAIGRDARDSGLALKAALIRGVTDAGCNVVDLDMLTTPMLYFASWHLLDVDGAISVTASHNPPEYNGVKVCRCNAVPVGIGSGLEMIRDGAIALLDSNADIAISDTPGSVIMEDIKLAYEDFVVQFADLEDKKFHIVIDCANTMGVLELPIFRRFADNITITELYCDLEHPYTAHEANPLNTSTMDELRAKVVEVDADLGIAYDGDADRIGFVDEHGEIIPMDLTTGLLARVLLAQNPGATVLYDLRSSQAVPEAIAAAGGIARECRVGHSFIKKQMREENALFAGELSGHYYFNANHNGELPTLAALTLLNLMAQTKQPISHLVADLRIYSHSGEINSDVQDKDAIIAQLKETYHDGALDELDGIKISYWDNQPTGSRWWFNVRASNTEPVLRLNVEADTQVLMEQKRDELLEIIRA
jgi:phosphomannomutase